jgi:hypothetical protein
MPKKLVFDKLNFQHLIKMEDTQYMSDDELIDEDEFDIMQTFGKQKESNLSPLPLIKFSH